MQSTQEQFVRLLSERSFGVEYVFEPDDFRDSTSQPREPADLVWACNNCIVLMYMQQRATKHPNPVTRSQRRKRSIEHNLRQAGGWLREWQAGQPLIGHNQCRNFVIPYGTYRYTVVLSVVDAGDYEGEYHHDGASRLGVAMCATVPQLAIQEIARIGGGIIELLFMINSLRTKGEELQRADTDALGVVRALHKFALQRADPKKLWLSGNAGSVPVTGESLIHSC